MPKIMRASITPKSAGGDDATFIEMVSVGMQTQDIIQMIDVYLELGLDNDSLQSLVEQYNDNVGLFLEDQGLIPAGTGEVLNLLQIGKTQRDAISLYALENSIDKETLKASLNILSSDGLLAALNGLTGTTPPDPGPEEPEDPDAPIVGEAIVDTAQL